jgi:WhiB family redox-sensing transcriptional regulator
VYDRHVIPTVFFTVGGRSRTGFRGGTKSSITRVERAKAMRAELFLLEPDAEEQGWQDRALCAQTDPEAFFPEKGGSTREAKKVCLTCEVRDDCLESALMNDERFGIWGGLSERERRKLKKRAV